MRIVLSAAASNKWVQLDIRPSWLGLVILRVFFWSATAGFASTNIDSTTVDKVAAMLPAKAVGLGTPITNREAWNRLAANATFAGVISNAEAVLAHPVPALPDSLYLDFSRTGNRDRAQAVLFKREDNLTALTLAECLENQGRFIPPLTNLIAAICAERAWIFPAHDWGRSNFYGKTVEIDLRASALAWEMGTLDYLLGDRLPTETRALIRENVRRRVLVPFRDMVEGRRDELSWLRGRNNWTAVCLAGVTGAALALEDSPEERAWFIVAAEAYIPNYLNGFTPDGYCGEGIGYWNYGFGHFIMLGEAIRQATGGQIDLLANPAALQPALFAHRAEVLPGIYPTISDCTPGTQPAQKFVLYLDERFGLSPPVDWKRLAFPLTRDLYSPVLFTSLPNNLPVAQRADRITDSPLRTWFSEGGVLICRMDSNTPLPFAAVIKGGNNGESHNHNDVGSFSVIAGKTMLVCDPGGEVYTSRTFSTNRYLSKVLNSYGHAVPRVAGKLQRTGANARAVVLRSDFKNDTDMLVFDLRSAYDVPDLTKLERTFVFHRSAGGSLTVRDEAQFASPQTFETALITWGQWKKISDHELLITDGGDAVRVNIDTAGRAFKIKSELLDEDVLSKRKTYGIAIVLKSPARNVAVKLSIVPGSVK